MTAAQGAAMGGNAAAGTVEHIREMARRLRIHSLRTTSKAGSGHPTSCLSAAEIMAGVFFHAMKFDVADPNSAASDRFVMSKGHAAPILYAALAEAGVFPVARLMTLREFSSELEGHPTPLIPGVDAATGSLGQGLSVGAGLALGAKYVDKTAARVYVLLGDGEMAEGNVWEAAAFAAHHGLDNLTAIVDVNALGQSDRTMYKHDTEPYRAKFAANGWDAHVIDGHDAAAVMAALDRARATSGKPQAIVARTHKGHGISFLQDKDGWHGKALSKDELSKALAELVKVKVVAEADLAKAIVKDASGKPRLALPGAGFDFGNYRRGWAGTWASLLTNAREFGDDEIAEAAANALEADGQRREDRGVAHYAAMSNLSNIQAVVGKTRRAGDFRRAVTEGPAESALRGPLLAHAKYPDVLVARAFSRGEDLALVLHPGAAPGVQRLGLARLAPGAAYQVRGAVSARFAADANGEASLDVPLHGRTALEIVRA